MCQWPKWFSLIGMMSAVNTFWGNIYKEAVLISKEPELRSHQGGCPGLLSLISLWFLWTYSNTQPISKEKHHRSKGESEGSLAPSVQMLFYAWLWKYKRMTSSRHYAYLTSGCFPCKYNTTEANMQKTTTYYSWHKINPSHAIVQTPCIYYTQKLKSRSVWKNVF